MVFSWIFLFPPPNCKPKIGCNLCRRLFITKSQVQERERERAKEIGCRPHNEHDRAPRQPKPARPAKKDDALLQPLCRDCNPSQPGPSWPQLEFSRHSQLILPSQSDSARRETVFSALLVALVSCFLFPVFFAYQSLCNKGSSRISEDFGQRGDARQPPITASVVMKKTDVLENKGNKRQLPSWSLTFFSFCTQFTRETGDLVRNWVCAKTRRPHCITPRPL